MARGAVTVAALLVASPVAADGPIVDRDYAIELYEGVAIGNTAWVGMGGAGAANIVGTSGTLINASAMAVRATTDTDTWTWDYHIDYLTGKYSSDYDNNGIVTGDNSGASLITGGLGGRIKDWALAGTGTIQTAPIVGTEYSANALRFRVALSKWFPARDIAVGLGVQNVLFQVASPRMQDPLFQINGGGVIGGITYVPRLRNYRIAGSVESQILGAEVTSTCNPDDCEGYILPREVVSPPRIVFGFAYRFAETEWNQLVGGVFRDEPSLTLTGDVLVTGPSKNSFGIEAFGMQMLQRSGRDTGISVRAGAEWECLPGRLRLRAGGYWEPARFEGEGGRAHITFGTEVRVLEVNVWGRRRGRLGVTGDIASRYRNIALSVGFWH